MEKYKKELINDYVSKKYRKFINDIEFSNVSNNLIVKLHTDIGKFFCIAYMPLFLGDELIPFIKKNVRRDFNWYLKDKFNIKGLNERR